MGTVPVGDDMGTVPLGDIGTVPVGAGAITGAVAGGGGGATGGGGTGAVSCACAMLGPIAAMVTTTAMMLRYAMNRFRRIPDTPAPRMPLDSRQRKLS